MELSLMNLLLVLLAGWLAGWGASRLGYPSVLGELLDSPRELARLGANGRKRALEVFSWKSVAAQTVAVYEQARERVGAC